MGTFMTKEGIKKRCVSCGKMFPLDEMQKNKSKPNGVSSRCKKCASEYARKWREAKAKELQEDRKNPHHGTFYGYVSGCRCDKCREAERVYMEEYRKRKNDF